MLEKRNWMQWRKMMHLTYTFAPASSQQRVQLASKVIVEPRLCFSSCPVHHSLSHVWQSIPECCNFFVLMDCYLHDCHILVPSLYALFWTCYTNPPIHSNFYFPMTDVFMVSKFFTKIPFLPPPFFSCTGGVSKWWTFSISGTLQIIFFAPIG